MHLSVEETTSSTHARGEGACLGSIQHVVSSDCGVMAQEFGSSLGMERVHTAVLPGIVVFMMERYADREAGGLLC